MTVVYNWDTITLAFESMYEYSKDGETGWLKQYAVHAIGMLQLIPQIRDLPEFNIVKLYFSLGKLVCESTISPARLLIGYAEDQKYYLQTYSRQNGYSEVKGYKLENVIPVLRQALKDTAS